MTFGAQVRATRHALGLSQAALAGLLDTDAQSISNWECGRNEPWPKTQVLVLSRLLDLQSTGAGTETKPIDRPRIIDRI